jgi:hypothetical protein
LTSSRPRRIGDSFGTDPARPPAPDTAHRAENKDPGSATRAVVDAMTSTSGARTTGTGTGRTTGRATAKFTVLLSLEDAAVFDELAVKVRRLTGRRVTKGEIVRTLVALASDDATLRHDLAAELQEKPS